MEPTPQRLTPAQAREKIKHYCAYSERCHSEVKAKLYAYGLHRGEVEPIVAMLIEENYLNEARYAVQFAGGHFRMKQWGRVKIKHALRSKAVSNYCIQKGLEAISDEDYGMLLEKLSEKKWQSTRGQLPAVRWAKTRQFLLQRGFESDLVLAVLQKLSGKKTG